MAANKTIKLYLLMKNLTHLICCILRRSSATGAFPDGHCASSIGQSERYYSTVLLTRASIAYDVMVKRRGGVNTAFAMAKQPIICYSCKEPFAA